MINTVRLIFNKKVLKSKIYESHKQYTDPLVCTIYTKKSTITTKKKKHKKCKRNS